MIEVADDPAEREERIETHGRLDGYSILAESPDLAGSTEAIPGPVLVYIQIDMFEDADGASGWIEATEAVITADVGSVDDRDVLYESSTPFDPGDFGDEAIGFVDVYDWPEGPNEVIFGIWIRVANHLGRAEVTRIDGEDGKPDVEAIARILEARMIEAIEG
jgi:hypothetical protein